MKPSIPAFGEAARDAAFTHHSLLAKPPGSLGRLEELAAVYCGAHGVFPPPPPDLPTLVLFAADHGAVADGCSAYPSWVSAAVLENVARGGSAVNALTQSAGVSLRLIDVGLCQPIEPADDHRLPIERRRVGCGTQSLVAGAAMTRTETERALAVGEEVAGSVAASGCKLAGVGEIGIGNTTAAAALIAAATRSPPRLVVGPGAGLDAAGLEHKIGLVERALARRTHAAHDGLSLLAELGGFELAALAGFMLGAARRRLPVVLDGVVTNAAALAAVRIDPGLAPYLIAAHGSTEPGAHVALEALGVRPLLELGMRLGEGSGAVLGLSLLKSSVELLLRMVTLESILARAPHAG
jgi:nicotinate-nucleotide--dimethylbenzimidazole phosphoribosyltransferase